ncbi:MAG: SCO family protein [Planctomycetota bacterium]|nr:SCO family protein [Planctomycetota bacterium]
MKSGLLVAWSVLLLTAVVGYGGFVFWRQFKDTVSSTANNTQHIGGAAYAGKGPVDFNMTTQNNQPFSAKSMTGKVWVVSFFFTNCTWKCLEQNQALSKLQKELNDPEIQFVSITCDPTRDTPEVMRKYAEQFNADPEQWLFVTGNMTQIQNLAKNQFLMSINQQTHSERALVIGPDGKILDFFDTLEPNEMKKMKAFLLKLKAESQPVASS